MRSFEPESTEVDLRRELAELSAKFLDHTITPSQARRFREIKRDLREIENARYGVQRW